MTGSFHFCGHVKGLVHDALVEGAVAKEGDGDAVLAADLGGQRHAGGVGHLGADDAIGAHQAQRGVDKVHRAALALGKTGGLAQHLGDGALGVHAAGQGVMMAAVGAGEIVVLRRAQAVPTALPSWPMAVCMAPPILPDSASSSSDSSTRRIRNMVRYIV